MSFACESLNKHRGRSGAEVNKRMLCLRAEMGLYQAKRTLVLCHWADSNPNRESHDWENITYFCYSLKQLRETFYVLWAHYCGGTWKYIFIELGCLLLRTSKTIAGKRDTNLRITYARWKLFFMVKLMQKYFKWIFFI